MPLLSVCALFIAYPATGLRVRLSNVAQSVITGEPERGVETDHKGSLSTSQSQTIDITEILQTII